MPEVSRSRMHVVSWMCVFVFQSGRDEFATGIHMAGDWAQNCAGMRPDSANCAICLFAQNECGVLSRTEKYSPNYAALDSLAEWLFVCTMSKLLALHTHKTHITTLINCERARNRWACTKYRCREQFHFNYMYKLGSVSLLHSSYAKAALINMAYYAFR